MVLIATISAAIFEALFLTVAIVFLIQGLKLSDTSEDNTIHLLCSVFGFGFAVAILIVMVYIIYVFRRQTDVYTDDKMFRKRGDKIIFEIPYKNIKDIKQGFDSVFFILNTPIKRLDGKAAPRNFYEHYAKKDIDRIIKIVSSFAYNNSIFKNGG